MLKIGPFFSFSLSLSVIHQSLLLTERRRGSPSLGGSCTSWPPLEVTELSLV